MHRLLTTLALFACPRGHKRDATSQFDVFDTTKTFWCSGCRGCHASGSWRCECVAPWQRCFRHFIAPTSLGSASSQTSQHVRRKKRPASIGAEQSAKVLTRLEPSIASRAFLGPTLPARFLHLVKEKSAPSNARVHRDAPSDCPTQSRTSAL